MDVWPACLRYLEAELPPEDVLTWLKPLQADHRDEGLVLFAPNAFVRDEVNRLYLPRIRELAAHFGGGIEVALHIGAMRRVEAPTVPGIPPRPAPGGMPAVVEPFRGNLEAVAYKICQEEPEPPSPGARRCARPARRCPTARRCPRG